MDWELRLNDAMSGPAARAAAALKPVEDKLRDVNRQLASSAIDKMNDGLEKQRAQLRLQRSDLANNLRAAQAQERAEARMDRAASRARAVAMREERLRARAAESQSRLEQRAKAAADRHFQRSAQQRQRLEEQVRARQARALAASARQEQAAQRASTRALERDKARQMAGYQKAQAEALEGQRGEVRGMLPGQAGMLMAIAAAAMTAAAAVAALGAAYARAIVSAIAFREAAIGAMTIMKNAVEARRTYEVGITLAARWNLDPRETVTQLQELVSKGFSGDESRVLLTAMADLKVLSPTANLGNLMLAIGQIKSKGVLQMEELQQQLAEAGVNVGKVLEIIGKRLGKSSADVRKMISAGKINSNMGIWAIVKSIEEMGGGKLGSVADKASQSIGSMIQGLQFRPGLLGLKIAEMLEGQAGQDAVRGALSNLLKATDPSQSPAMKQMLMSAADLANELLQMLFGPMAGAGGAGALQDVLARMAVGIQLIADGVRAVRPVVHAFLEGFGEGGSWVVDILLALGKSLGFGDDLSSGADGARVLGKALAIIAGVAAGLVVAIMGTSAQILAFVHAMASAPAAVVTAAAGILAAVEALPAMLLSAGILMGTNLWTGFVQGIDAGITAITDAGSRLANAAKSAVAGALQIKSPSRVMMEMGGYTAAGFAQGVDGGAGQVDASMREMVVPPAPVLGQGGSSTSNTLSAGGITVNIVVQGDGPGADPKALGAEVSTAVAQALENMLAQMGLSPTPTPA